MSGHTRPKLLAVICILAAALTASRAAATAETPQGVGCNTIPKLASAGGASVVQATGESLQHKSWQPQGGEIEFTVKSIDAIPAKASVFVCFRWKSTPESKTDFKEPPSPPRLDMNGDGKLLKVTTTVPDLGTQPKDVAKALPLVPLAEVRILAIDNIDNEKKETAADVTTEIGITYPVAASIFAIFTVILGFVVTHRSRPEIDSLTPASCKRIGYYASFRRQVDWPAFPSSKSYFGHSSLRLRPCM